MGFAGMISRDFIDKDIGTGTSYGWSPISPHIHYTAKEKSIAKTYGITQMNEVANIENIVFFDNNRSISESYGKIELIQKWRFITEHRINTLLSLKRDLWCQGSILSLQASLSEIERAHENVINILSEDMEAVYCNQEKDHSDDDFEQIFAGELFGRLLGYFKTINDSESAKAVVHDLKYLAAVIMQTKDMDGDYRCSAAAYVQLLKEPELGLNYIDKECDDCRIENVFTDFSFCIVCGRRL